MVKIEILHNVNYKLLLIDAPFRCIDSWSKPEPIADAKKGDPESTTFTEGLVDQEFRQADELARAFDYEATVDNERHSNDNDHISSL